MGRKDKQVPPFGRNDKLARGQDFTSSVKSGGKLDK